MTLFNFPKPSGLASLLLAFVILVGCTSGQPTQPIHDPQENANRKVHRFNKALDKNLFSPVATGYGAVVPIRADKAISNFAEHVSIPGEVVNSLLQFDIQSVVINTIRFTVNSVFGLGGLYDFASEAGVPDVETDFGETLYVLGFPEGEYVELPAFGASTERAAWGLTVDFFLDPLNFILPSSAAKYKTPLFIVDKLGDRHQYADVINGILYESEDSYTTQRTIYLQNRRFKLGGRQTISDDNLEDPYAD